MNLLPFMKQWQMLPPAGGIVLCAVSGGRDSMCLLHYLSTVALQQGFTVAAAHLNHCMRPEADSDEAFVRRFCDERKIPFYTEAVPVYEKAQEWKASVEETGRRLRYDFLSRVAEKIGADRIATAHHKNDHAETVLLNLLRGSGSEGLGGIPPVRGKFVRPLLETSRSEIEEYCVENGIGHVEDSTNYDTHYVRARLRHELWPQLECINQNLTETLSRTAGLLRSENAYLDQLAGRLLPEEGTTVSLTALNSAHEVLRRRMLRQMLRRLPTGKKDVSAAHITALLELVETGRGTLTLPDGARAEADGMTLRFFVAQAAPEEQMLVEGTTRWGEFTITVEGPCEGLTVRPWRREDRLAVETGFRRLKRIFSDGGVAPAQRDRHPVICLQREPVGVYVNKNCHFTLSRDGETLHITIKKEELREDTDHG